MGVAGLAEAGPVGAMIARLRGLVQPASLRPGRAGRGSGNPRVSDPATPERDRDLIPNGLVWVREVDGSGVACEHATYPATLETG